MKKILFIFILLIFILLFANSVFAYKGSREAEGLSKGKISTKKSIGDNSSQKEILIGCESCHDESFSLYSQTKAVANHPTETPDGTEMDDKTELPACMQCHAINIRTGKGVRAPKAMDAIVHPVHFFNKIFINELGGSCYTCHVVGRMGNFDVVYKKLKTDDRGIPNKEPVKVLRSSYIGTYVTAAIIGVVILLVTLIISIVALVLSIKAVRRK